MDKPQIIIHAEKSYNHTVFDVVWVPCSAKFIVAGSLPRGTGLLEVMEITKGDVQSVTQVHKDQSFKCATFGSSSLYSRSLATGDFGGNLNIWDMENFSQPVYKAKAHDGILNAIDGVGGQVGHGAPEIATCGLDGKVKVWDARQRDRPVAVMETKDGSKRDCWTVSFGNSYNDEERVLAAGYDNGDLKIFDLRKMSILWETNLKNGVCSVQFDRKDTLMNKLVAATLEGRIHVFDMSVQHHKSGYNSLCERSQKSTVWLCRHLPQNRDIFMTTGGDGSLYLWKYNYPGQRHQEGRDGHKTSIIGTLTPLQHVTVSSQPITGYDWNSDKTGLGVCASLDQTVRVILVTRLASC